MLAISAQLDMANDRLISMIQRFIVTKPTLQPAIIVTCMLLSVIHRRNQEEEHRELVEYYEEQSGLRRSLTALYAAAPNFHVESTLDAFEASPYEKGRKGSLYYRD